MTPKQLPLSASPPTPTVRRDPEFRVIQVTSRDEKEARKRGHVALGIYVGRFTHKPQEIRCHPVMAEAIGMEVMGIPVIVDPRCQLADLWLGPLGEV